MRQNEIVSLQLHEADLERSFYELRRNAESQVMVDAQTDINFVLMHSPHLKTCNHGRARQPGSI